MGVQNTDSSTIIELNHISVTFREGGRTVEAVKDVTMHVREGEIFGIVGFSGAGKSNAGAHDQPARAAYRGPGDHRRT